MAPLFAWSGAASVGNFESIFDIGGGGYSKSMDIANDGTKVSTVDIWGAYLAQPGAGTSWSGLINSTSFSSVTTCSNNNFPSCWQFDGPWDARIAHSNSQIITVNWNGQLYLSSNQGASFASVSGASGLPIETNTVDTGGNGSNWCNGTGPFNNSTARLSNPKTNIDPTQSSLGSLTITVPTARYGTYISKNGGTTFATVPTIPIPLPCGGQTATTSSPTTSGATLNFSSVPNTPFSTTIASSGNTYTSGTGVVSLNVNNAPNVSVGMQVIVSSATGTGSFASINGLHATVTGTTGNTVNFTIATGLTMTITGGALVTTLNSNYLVVDKTHPFAIPPNTNVSSVTASTVVLTNSVNSTVSTSDVIDFYYPGNDGNPQLMLTATDPTNGSYIYISVPGAGVLVSTNGGASFAATTGGTPPGVTDVGSSLAICKDGRAYFVDQQDTFVYVYNPATPAWTKSSQNGIWAVACDPSVSTGAVSAVGPSGNMFVSADHGVTWFSTGTDLRSSPQIPWLAITPEAMNSSEIQYDPQQSQILYESEGIGVWYTTVVQGGAGSHTWISQSENIESLTGAGIIKSPAYTYPFMLVWDRAGFSTTNPNSYAAPAVQYPLSNTAGSANAIIGGWNGDYAAGTSTFCVLANSNFGALTPISGCTTDGVNFTQFPVEPDALPLVTSTGSAVGSNTLTFSSVPITISDDFQRLISDIGTMVTPTGTISSGAHVFAVTGLTASVKVGDVINTVGPGFNTAPGYQGTGNGTQAQIEGIAGSTLTVGINAAASIPTSTQIEIQQPIEYKSNLAAPDTTHLCFPYFEGDFGGIGITGTNVSHATHVNNFTTGGSCGSSPAGEITVTLDTAMSVSDPGNTNFFLAIAYSPLPGNQVQSSGNTGTTIALPNAVAYNNRGGNPGVNTDGVRTGETIVFFADPGSAMAVSSPTNIMYSREDNHSGAPFPLYTTDGGNTWPAAILCNDPAGSLCGTMAGFNSDGSSTSNSCYAGGHGGFPKMMAADRVRANTFYVFNRCGHGNGTGIGIYRTRDSGLHWTRTQTDAPPGNINLGSGAGMVSVPGQQDHVFWSNGNGSDGAHGNDTSGDLYRSCDGTSSWFPVDSTNLLNVYAFDFGAATPGGNGYPSIIIYGNVNSVWGKWRGDNASTTCGAGQTVAWTKIGDQFFAGQLNVPDLVWLAGDTNNYGKFYINNTGPSVWGLHNFLLKRDLDPASNDDTPAGLNKAA